MARQTDQFANDGPASSAYGQFAAILAEVQGQPSSSLLNPESGLALLFAEICHERALEAEGDAVAGGLASLTSRKVVQPVSYGAAASYDPISANLLELFDDDGPADAVSWQLEEQTWRLIHLLHAERRKREIQDGLALPSTSTINPYQTPLAAAQDIIEGDAALSELSIVRDWLSGNLACQHPVEVRKGYWPFTKHRLRNERRTATPVASGQSQPGSSRNQSMRGSSQGRGALVTSGANSKGVRSLDPDSVSRESSTLELEDAAYEKALNKTLFEYARGGQLNDAVDLARQTDRSWRAASLRGANLYWRPGLDSLTGDANAPPGPIGNRNRTLWKAVCRSLCTKSSLDEYERALYGSLSGDLKSVLSVSTTWESQLWAYANARLEAALDRGLEKTGSWWSQEAGTTFKLESSGKDLGAVHVTELRSPGDGDATRALGSSAEGDAPLAVELRDVFVRLAQTENHGIHLQANHLFRVVQRAIILSEIPALMAHIESLLISMRVNVSQTQYGGLVRFLAHLVLYLRNLRWNDMPSENVCNSILKAYVDILEVSGEDELVAFYASSLEPRSAVESYAHYLKSLDAHESMNAKRSALMRAEAHDLDVAAVAVLTASMIFDEIFPSLIPTLTVPKTPLEELSTAISPLEERLLRALDWLCIHESTYADAVVHVNMLMRLFLNNGRLNAARTLLFNLPPEVIEVLGALDASGDPDLQAGEFIQWRSFFDALDRHMGYVEIWSRRPADSNRTSRMERLSWTKALDGIVIEARNAISQILQMDWLKLDINQDNIHSERRLMELARIRQLYIPELIFRLFSMLYETRDILPTSLPAAIELPNVVADERHKLYLDFISGEENRIKDFLALVRRAQMAALERSSDPFQLVLEFTEL